MMFLSLNFLICKMEPSQITPGLDEKGLGNTGLAWGLGLQGPSHKPRLPFGGQWGREQHAEGGKEVWVVSVLGDLEQFSSPLWASLYALNTVRSEASRFYKQND